MTSLVVALTSVISSIFLGTANSHIRESSSLSPTPWVALLQGANPLNMTQGDTYIENGIILSEALLDRISSEGLASPTVAYEYSKVAITTPDFLIQLHQANLNIPYSPFLSGE